MALVHKFKQGNDYFVLDVNSGAVHLIDELVYDILDDDKLKDKEEVISNLKDKYEISELSEAYDEIKELVDEEVLYSKDQYEDIANSSMDDRDYIKALCLNVIHGCNLRCKYCFADEGEYNGHKGVMSLETAKKAIDYVVKRSGPRKNIEIDLFGGEPTLIMDTIKEIIKYARENEKKWNKNIRFTMTTNSTLLDDEMMEYMDKEMGNIILSLDGRKEVNDKVRILMTNPRVAIPMLFTTEEAQKFARICESWYTLCDRFISKSTQPINPEFRKALFNTVPQYNNNGNLMRDMAAGCGKNVTELAFMPDGTITDCYTNYMQGREDYEAQCNDEDKITSRIYKNLNYNPLKCSDEEAVEQLWLNTICLKNAKSLKTTLGAGIVKELALSGQVPHKFLDRDLRLRGSRFSQCQSDCIVQNVITTRVPLLLNAGAYRLHLNGLFDLVEKDLKDR